MVIVEVFKNNFNKSSVQCGAVCPAEELWEPKVSLGLAQNMNVTILQVIVTFCSYHHQLMSQN